jgi:hypothetical protein
MDVGSLLYIFYPFYHNQLAGHKFMPICIHSAASHVRDNVTAKCACLSQQLTLGFLRLIKANLTGAGISSCCISSLLQISPQMTDIRSDEVNLSEVFGYIITRDYVFAKSKFLLWIQPARSIYNMILSSVESVKASSSFQARA